MLPVCPSMRCRISVGYPAEPLKTLKRGATAVFQRRTRSAKHWAAHWMIFTKKRPGSNPWPFPFSHPPAFTMPETVTQKRPRIIPEPLCIFIQSKSRRKICGCSILLLFFFLLARFLGSLGERLVRVQCFYRLRPHNNPSLHSTIYLLRIYIIIHAGFCQDRFTSAGYLHTP